MLSALSQSETPICLVVRLFKIPQELELGDFNLTCSQSACGSAAKKLRMYSTYN